MLCSKRELTFNFLPLFLWGLSTIAVPCCIDLICQIVVPQNHWKVLKTKPSQLVHLVDIPPVCGQPRWSKDLRVDLRFVTVLEYLFIGRRRVVAVGRRRRVWGRIHNGVRHPVDSVGLYRHGLLGHWGVDRMSSEGHVEGWLIPQRRRIHPSANEEARSTAEEHGHHQQQPEVPESLDGQRPHTAASAAAVLIRAAYEVDRVSSLKVPAVLLGFYHL